MTVIAPPGKLGIILANKADSKGTVVSGVRTSSVLAEKISPGDRIIAIDGEDVSLMTVSEITTIMARKSDFERTELVKEKTGVFTHGGRILLRIRPPSSVFSTLHHRTMDVSLLTMSMSSKSLRPWTCRQDHHLE